MKMQKRGQLGFFLILSMVIVIAAGFIFYVKSLAVQKPIEENPSQSASTDIVKSYAETCIKTIAEEALFKKIGPQGGYISPKGQPNIDNGALTEPVLYYGKSVPYFLSIKNGQTSYYTEIPTIKSIEKKLESQIVSEFENCFDTTIFKDKGIDIAKPSSRNNVKAIVGMNREDISISMQYPMVVKKGSIQSNLESFSVSLPIRLKSLHEWASALVENIKNKQPQEYDISSNCNFDSKGLTNIYLGDLPGDGKIIRFVDYSTFYQKYLIGFEFQFAVKDAHIKGECVKRI